MGVEEDVRKEVMYNFRNLTQVPRVPMQIKEEIQPIGLLGFPLGLRTSLPSSMLNDKEMSSCVDFFLNKGGQLQSRPAWKKYTDVAVTGGIISIGQGYVDGEYLEFVQGGDYKLYYLLDVAGVLTPTLIGTLEGSAQIISYNDTVVLLDGGYMKEVRSKTELGLLYNSGDDAECF